MSKKDKKAEKKAEKKALKAAAKKAKKDKLLEAKAAEMAAELRSEREAALDVEDPQAVDAVAVVEQKLDQKVEEPEAASTPYTPVEGEKLKVISLKMPESLIEATDEAAANCGDGVSRSEFIRMAIERMVNENR